MDIQSLAASMKSESPYMASSSHEMRLDALRAVQKALVTKKEEIFAANEKDLFNAKEANVISSVMKRLKFDQGKLDSVVSGIDTLLELPDPIGKTTLHRMLDEDLKLRGISVPIGVIGVIFEARPDALVQIASLCIKSGNMCILKGGKETEETNRVLFDLIKEAATSCGLPKHCLVRVSLHNEISELLKCNKSVDLIIPRGSNEFVKYIMDNTSIPVLGHADGICHTYIHSKANIDIVGDLVVDAKTQYPAACNATETLLIDRKIANKVLPMVYGRLKECGVEVFGTQEVSDVVPVEVIEGESFRKEYGDMAIAIKIVSDYKEAVDHINYYGSHHTDAIITEDEEAWEYFAAMVDSAGVYKNASTRFADGFRYGFGAEVGISTSKIHARGPVGLAGLMTYKYTLEGSGNVVADYSNGVKSFSFKDI